MAFGLPGTEPSDGSSQFLGRIQYDSRVGFWKIVKRAQGSDGRWGDDIGEPFKNPTFLMDFGGLEVGFMKIASPPVFVLVPYGSPLPPRPAEMVLDDQGKQRPAFTSGFRVKVAGKVFGDGDAYYWTANAKTVMTPVDELYHDFLSRPEAVAGQIPAVACTGTKVIEVTGGNRSAKFYAPVFQIVGWSERLAVFGERTVPAPSAVATAAPQKPVQAAANGAGASHPPGHVGPPGGGERVAEKAPEGMPF